MHLIPITIQRDYRKKKYLSLVPDIEQMLNEIDSVIITALSLTDVYPVQGLSDSKCTTITWGIVLKFRF